MTALWARPAQRSMTSVPSLPEEAAATRGGFLVPRAFATLLIAGGGLLTAAGAVAVALLAVEPLWQRLVVAGIASVLAGGATVLLHDVRRGRIRLLGGELIVDAAFAYVVVALASRPEVASLRSTEFVIGLAGLALGVAGMALAPLAQGGIAEAVRRAVITVTGTILVAVAVGQFEHPGLSMRWNWIPFLGFAVPGMLVLLAAEMAGRDRRLRLRVAIGGVTGAAGITLLLYGSVNNLGLGAGGWGAGLGADAGTVTAWLVAVTLLICGSSTRPRWSAMRGAVLSAAGIIGMAVSERSAILRVDVGLGPIGAASSRGLPILVAAIVVLVVLPALSRRQSDVLQPSRGRRLARDG